MENYLTFKGEKYFNQAAGGVYRTADSKKVFYINAGGEPVWLYSDSPIHIELRDYLMMDKGYPHGEPKKLQGEIRDITSEDKGN